MDKMMNSMIAKYEAEEASRDNVIKLVKGMQSSLFATQDTIEDAFEYAYSIINTLPNESKASVICAIQVLVNTIAEEVKRTAEGSN